MLAMYFFLIDVSMNAIQTGATAAACSAISQVISDLPVSFMPICKMQNYVIIQCTCDFLFAAFLFLDSLYYTPLPHQTASLLLKVLTTFLVGVFSL